MTDMWIDGKAYVLVRQDRPAHAQLLLALRAAFDWSQRDLAARLGVALRTVQRWESGEVDPPSYLLSLARLWLGIEKPPCGG